MKVTVYTSCDSVRLELNGKVVAEKPVSAGDRMKVQFDVPYEPGELRAIGVSTGKQSVATLRTVGAPAAIRLTPDRAAIRADRNDLAYVKVEVVDAKGELVPDANVPIRFAVSGAGELAATGSAAPNVPESFRAPARTTFQGRCLVILRPKGGAGQILLKAEANGLKPATLVVKTR
jgi:beta-galactosidase